MSENNVKNKLNYIWKISNFREVSTAFKIDSPIICSKGVMWQLRMYPRYKSDQFSQHTYVSIYIFCLGPFFPLAGWMLQIVDSLAHGGGLRGARRQFQFKSNASRGYRKFCRTSKLMSPRENYLNADGEICIKLSLDWESPRFAGKSSSDLLKKQLSENENLLDFSLKGPKWKIKVHKAVISGLSPLFERMFLSSYKENLANEAFFSDIDEKTIKGIVEFAYGGNALKLLKESVSSKIHKALKPVGCSDFSEKVQVVKRKRAEGDKSKICSGAPVLIEKSANYPFIKESLFRGNNETTISDINDFIGNNKNGPKSLNKIVFDEYFDAILKLFVASDRYLIDDLKRICENKIREMLSIENAVKTVKICLFVVPKIDFAQIINKNDDKSALDENNVKNEVFGMASKNLLFFVVEFIALNLERFFERNDFKRFIKKHSDFVSNVFLLAKRMDKMRTGKVSEIL
ncbi:hypothetical protein MHBO_001847 [Bonamia ostreae]|uniref:BTB domain-containing protein n=1 Tax=Bonamia ostreae TaxID=126728 RepID=A0ABV2AKC8_9EUKA